jgi:hypothetical protein
MKKYKKKPNKIIMPHIYRFKQKKEEVEFGKESYEVTTIGKWRKSKVNSRSSPSYAFIVTTDEPEDLTISATTNRLHDEKSSSLSKVTSHVGENDEAVRTDLEPEVEPESTEPDLKHKDRFVWRWSIALKIKNYNYNNISKDC